MKLFKYEGYKVVISEEALLLKPFKKLWDRDRSNSKNKALSELAFVYFYCDPRSDYQYIIDNKDREKAIKEGEGLPLDWCPDKLVTEAITFYNTFKSTGALLLESVKGAVDKLIIKLKDINLEQVDDKGKPVYALNTITATIKAIPGLVKELDIAEKTLASEMRDSGKMRGNAEKTILEDGL